MNIVDRLNDFLEKSQITKSQFADSCDIPRPTASQILSGRNKKISDDIISKIHNVYPELSISWLMFGEGEMLVSGISYIDTAKPSEISLFEDNSGNSSDNSKENQMNSAILGCNTLSNKQITKIVVFYSDNSFEEFFQK